VRKSYARFLGEGRAVTLEPYPTIPPRLYLNQQKSKQKKLIKH